MKYIGNMEMTDSKKYTENPNEMTICHNFAEYLEALDKYWKYRNEMFEKKQPYISRFKYIGQPDCTGQEHYLFEYDIIGKEKLSEVSEKEEVSKVLQAIINDVICHYGKQTESGELIGIQITEEDAYYILNDNGTYHYSSCVGSIPA